MTLWSQYLTGVVGLVAWVAWGRGLAIGAVALAVWIVAMVGISARSAIRSSERSYSGGPGRERDANQ